MISRTKSYLKGTQNDDRNVKSLYDFRAPSYDSSWHPQFAKNLFLHLTDPPLSPGNRCLDLCCGTGLVTFLAAQQVVPGGRVYGIDVSEAMLHVARAKQNNSAIQNSSKVNENHFTNLTDEERNCVQLIHHDVEDLSGLQELAGLEETFDLVSCASGLVLLRDPANAIKSWGKWLKPGTGRMILDAPHPLNLRAGIALENAASRQGIEVPFNRAWIKSEKSLQEVLEQSGELEVIKMEFVEQQGGAKKSWDSTKDIAQEKFDSLMYGETLQIWTQSLDSSTLKGLKEAFCEEWKNAADKEGKLEEVDGVWLAIAKKKL